MKKLLVASALLASALAVSGANLVHAAAASPATITISYDSQNHVYSLSAGTVYGSIGDTFTLVNNTGSGLFTVAPVTADLYYTNPPLGVQSGLCGAVVCMSDWDESMIPDLILRIDAYGTVNLVNSNTQASIGQITFAPAQAPGFQMWNNAYLDSNGGTCTVDGKVQERVFEVTGLLKRFPGSDDCVRPGYRLQAWVSGGITALPNELVTSYGSVFEARWSQSVPPAPPGPATALVNFQCAPCAKADLWWYPSPTAGATYEVVLSQADDTGKFSTVSKTSVAQAPVPKTDPFTLTDLTAGTPYRIEVFAVEDGVRSEKGALFAPVTQANKPSLSEFSSSILQTPTNFADFVLAGPQCTLTITDSGRTTVSGKPGVFVGGTAAGLPTGAELNVWVRFPGQTSYTQGSARPQVNETGGFEWSRKTGKKTYVYVTSKDESCQSNKVVIPAN